jgi:hypothetical protein
VKHLGKGGCGEVFLAREWRPDILEIDTPLNPFVALKIVKVRLTTFLDYEKTSNLRYRTRNNLEQSSRQ